MRMNKQERERAEAWERLWELSGLPATVERFNEFIQAFSLKPDLFWKRDSRPSSGVRRECRNYLGMLALHYEIRQQLTTKKDGPTTVDLYHVLRLPALSNPRVVVEFNAAGSEFRLKPLNDSEMGYGDCYDWIYCQAPWSNPADRQAALAIKKSGDIASLFRSKAHNGILLIGRLSASLGSEILRTPPLFFRRIDFNAHISTIRRGQHVGYIN